MNIHEDVRMFTWKAKVESLPDWMYEREENALYLKPITSIVPGVTSIEPGGMIPLHFDPVFANNSDALMPVLQGDYTLFLMGLVRYEDEHGRQYETQMCLRLADPKTLTLVQCQQFNNAN